MDRLTSEKQWAEQWLRDTALPFWEINGYDEARGGFVEQFDLTGQPSLLDYKRTRVTARQLFVFSHGVRSGLSSRMDIVQSGYDFLKKSWMGDDLGWARRVTPDGVISDKTIDLYDHAFVLFALAHAGATLRSDEAIDLAKRTLVFMDRALPHPSGKGYVSVVPYGDPSEQNPHMHVTEALVALYDLTRDPAFLARETAMVDLFENTFFDKAHRVLPEFFDAQWRPLPDRLVIEPGHQLEWAWILHHHERLSGADMSATINALVSTAEAHGINRDTKLVYDQLTLDHGALVVKSADNRLWPHTERLKAHLALLERTGTDKAASTEAAADSLEALRAVFLNPAHTGLPNGTWMDHYFSDGRPRDTKIPSSSLYHLYLAIAEAIRVIP